MAGFIIASCWFGVCTNIHKSSSKLAVEVYSPVLPSLAKIWPVLSHCCDEITDLYASNVLLQLLQLSSLWPSAVTLAPVISSHNSAANIISFSQHSGHVVPLFVFLHWLLYLMQTSCMSFKALSWSCSPLSLWPPGCAARTTVGPTAKMYSPPRQRPTWIKWRQAQPAKATNAESGQPTFPLARQAIQPTSYPMRPYSTSWPTASEECWCHGMVHWPAPLERRPEDFTPSLDRWAGSTWREGINGG